MVFNAEQHDEGDKTILGQKGAFMPHDFVDLALAQPAASRHLARKLSLHFVGPSASSTLIEAVASEIVTSGWQIRSALRKIFYSGEFRSGSVRAGAVKSPAEFTAGALRSLGLTSDDHLRTGLYWMGQAGQSLFDPPNVGGWPANEGWLGGAGILGRYNAAVQIADLHMGRLVFPGQTRLRAATIEGWGEIFGVTELATATRDALNGYVSDAGATDEATLDSAMITLMISSPDFILA
jgi:uncharacterized protein (DUF1800 family)